MTSLLSFAAHYRTKQLGRVSGEFYSFYWWLKFIFIQKKFMRKTAERSESASLQIFFRFRVLTISQINRKTFPLLKLISSPGAKLRKEANGCLAEQRWKKLNCLTPAVIKCRSQLAIHYSTFPHRLKLKSFIRLPLRTVCLIAFYLVQLSCLAL